MKLLVDMNLSPRWIGVLAEAGIEAAHWSSLGAKNAPDSEIMAYANANDYVVLTNDLDFGAILKSIGWRPLRTGTIRTGRCFGYTTCITSTISSQDLAPVDREQRFKNRIRERWAPPSPRKILPRGQFQARKPSSAPITMNAVVKMNSSPTWRATQAMAASIHRAKTVIGAKGGD